MSVPTAPSSGLPEFSSLRAPGYSAALKTLRVGVDETGVAQVLLNRASKMNSLSMGMFQELRTLFEQLSSDDDVRCVMLLGGECRMFSAGIDLETLTSMAPKREKDVARDAIAMTRGIKMMQEAFLAVRRCTKPVIGVAYKMCIGAALELLSACDIRYCTADCVLSIREPRMGLAADLGALQRMPRLANGNSSLLTVLAYTGRDFTGAVADQKLGFCETLDSNDKSELEGMAYKTAMEISSLSPVAVYGTKQTLLYSAENSEEQGLEFVRNLNGALLQSDDLMKAVQASMTKRRPSFSKL
ncbi:unnamed protein product [Amoebophrya sp. A25]|nr:unnamed protein product [Amoebophrya sp. A25]|eukprot:GSA25T00015957001.1